MNESARARAKKETPYTLYSVVHIIFLAVVVASTGDEDAGGVVWRVRARTRVGATILLVPLSSLHVRFLLLLLLFLLFLLILLLPLRPLYLCRRDCHTDPTSSHHRVRIVTRAKSERTETTMI